MPVNNPHKYFLMVDTEIIEFPDYLGFKDMTSFRTLSFFTGLFTDEESLLEALKNLGLISSWDETTSAVIAKRTGNKKSGYSYKVINDDILYRSASRFISSKSCEEFLFENRSHRNILRKFLATYIEDLESLIKIFERKIEELEELAYRLPYDKRTKINNVIESKSNSLVNFKISLANLVELLNVLAIMDLNGTSDYRLESEFQSRIGYFVDSETHYIKGSSRTKNFRGLIKLATRVDSFLSDYRELKAPSKDTFYIADKINMLNKYKEAINNASKEKERIDVTTTIDTTTPGDEPIEPVDPDTYSFLEPDDFLRLINSDSSASMLESVAADIETHEAIKKRI